MSNKKKQKGGKEVKPIIQIQMCKQIYYSIPLTAQSEIYQQRTNHSRSSQSDNCTEMLETDLEVS